MPKIVVSGKEMEISEKDFEGFAAHIASNATKDKVHQKTIKEFILGNNDLKINGLTDKENLITEAVSLREGKAGDLVTGMIKAREKLRAISNHKTLSRQNSNLQQNRGSEGRVF